MRTPLCKITYIQEHHNIILLGATGSGKTYLACALGMAAVRRFYAVKYIQLPDLLVEFQIARGNGTIRKLMAQYRVRRGYRQRTQSAEPLPCGNPAL